MAAAALLAACNTTGSPTASLSAPHGPSVAFESIDGPPPDIFRKLVTQLNEGAQTRRLAVVSRESTSSYRVRGYLAARVEGGKTAISWAWDVYDAEQRRATRITGTQSRPGKRKASDAWSVADDAMLKSIAESSLDQLAGFLASSDDVAPVAQPIQVATQDGTYTPEAAGIFRMFQTRADPVPEGDSIAPGPAEKAAVPLPPLRPAPVNERIAGPAGVAMSARRR